MSRAAKSSYRFTELEELAKRQRQAAERERILQLVAQTEQQKQLVQVFIRIMQERQAEAARQEALRTYAPLRQSEADSRATAAEKQQEDARAAAAERQAAAAEEKAARDAAEAAKAAEIKTQQQRDAKDKADRDAAEQVKAATLKVEQEQQQLHKVHLSAQAWKLQQEATTDQGARTSVRDFQAREMRRLDEQWAELQKKQPGDSEKFEAFGQYVLECTEAMTFPEQNLRGKSPQEIMQLAREGYDAQRKQDEVQPFRNGPDRRAAIKDALTRNDGTVQMQPQQATMDTRGFGRGEDVRGDARPAPRGEMTDRRQREEHRPMTDREAFKAAKRANAEQRSAERERGDDDGGRELTM